MQNTISFISSWQPSSLRCYSSILPSIAVRGFNPCSSFLNFESISTNNSLFLGSLEEIAWLELCDLERENDTKLLLYWGLCAWIKFSKTIMLIFCVELCIVYCVLCPWNIDTRVLEKIHPLGMATWKKLCFKSQKLNYLLQ
jgi:hypothetical protein